MPDQIIYMYIAAQLIFALMCCFFGYKIVRLAIFLGSIFIFGSVFYYLLIEYFNFSDVINIIIAVLLSAVIGSFGYFLYKLSLFGIGVLSGLIVSYSIFNSYFINFNLSQSIQLSVTVGICILFGILILLITRPCIIVFLSFCGAFTFSTIGTFLIKNFDNLNIYSSLIFKNSNLLNIPYFFNQNILVIFAATFVLTVLGCIVQFKYTAKKIS